MPTIYPASKAVKTTTDRVQSAIQLIHHLTGQRYIPFPNPVSMEHHHLQNICNKTYGVREKTDGVQFGLILGQCASNGASYSMMFDRSELFFDVEIRAPLSYFSGGTLMYGELAWEKTDAQPLKEKIWWAFEMICLKGISYVNRPLLDRYEILQKTLESADGHAIIVSANPQLRAKRLYPLNELPALWRQMQSGSIQHPTDGLIFDPLTVGVQFHSTRDTTNNTEFVPLKWKENHTIDVEVRNGALWIREDTKSVSLNELLFPISSNTFARLVPAWNISEDTDGSIIECSIYCESDTTEKQSDGSGPVQPPRLKTFELLKVEHRKQRKTPNHRLVVERTLKGIVQPVMIGDLLLIAAKK